MWFAGLLIFGLLGAALSDADEVWMVLAALGGVAGGVLQYRLRSAQRTDIAELARRVGELENAVRRLREVPADGSEVAAGDAAVGKASDTAPAERPGAAPRPVVETAPAKMPDIAPGPMVDIAPGTVPDLPAETTPAFAAAATQAAASEAGSHASRGAGDAGAVPAATPAQALGEPIRVSARAASEWWQRLLGGNILAKIGVVLLFFGIASGLKLAIDHGFFPPSVRLLMGTVAGAAMLAIGLSRVRDASHRMFALALQGGGFAVLYLVVHFAFAWYGFIGATPAFAAFAALGLACLALAVRFDGLALAVLGMSGAYAAPLLASQGSGSHLVLFAFHAALNLLVIAANMLRPWRGLEVLGLAFTLFAGTAWASQHFEPSLFASTEAFLVLFAVQFSLAPVAHAVFARRPLAHWADVSLVFATPVGLALAQTWIVRFSGYGDTTLAWSAVAAGAWYAGLWWLLVASRVPAAWTRAHASISIAFFTLAVPLAFGAEVTSAFWAIEGMALAHAGWSQRLRIALAAGLLMQLFAGLWFLDHVGELHRMLPLVNGVWIGGMLVAVCGTATAWSSLREATSGEAARAARTVALAAGAWSLPWWIGTHWAEIDHFVAPAHRAAWQAAMLAATGWMLEGAGVAWQHRASRSASIAVAALAVAIALPDGSPFWTGSSHPLRDGLVFVLPASFATLLALLARVERNGGVALAGAGHAYAVWMLAALGAMELSWVARTLAPSVSLWPMLAWLLSPAAAAWAATAAVQRGVAPFASRPALHLELVAPVLLLAAAAAALVANFSHSGGGSGAPYLPIASFFDAAQILLLLAVLAWSRAIESSAADEPDVDDPARAVGRRQAQWRRRDLRRTLLGVAAAVAFVWVSAMAMRIAHHWAGVPFAAEALWRSGVAQGMLSVAWTMMALALMMSATRMRERRRWFAGFVLLGIVGAKFVLVDVANEGTITWTLSLIGVGLLILAASYFSPAPPRSEDDASAPEARADAAPGR